MRRNIKTLLLSSIALILTIASCDLQRLPETNLSDANFWKTEDNFKSACNQFSIYVSGPDIVYDNYRSDFLTTSLGLNEISDGSRVTPYTSADWDNDYKMIFTANKIIEEATNADFSTINRWIGEAKFWRAYAYFDLVKKFGDVPLVLKVLDVGSPKFQEGRTDRKTVIQQIYKDLDSAAAALPAFQELGKAGYGRISNGAAMALKSRVGLYFGTHEKFHQWGDPATDLTIAVNAAEAVMSMGYQLYTEGPRPYFNLFQYAGEGFANKENILAIIYGQNLSNNIRAHNIDRRNQNGEANVTRAMVEQYLCTDGLPFDKSPLAEWPETSPGSVFKNKDPRMGASLYREGDPYNNPDIYAWNRPAITTQYGGKKYCITADWLNSQSFVDVDMIRYAEVLLNYAEAKFELNGSISDEDLDKSINLLRDRVGMPHLTNAFVTAHGLDMRTEIRRERNVELAQEGFRYDDIIRWKIAENVLPERMIGATYFPVYGSGLNVTDDGYILIESADKRHFDPQKDYLYPIPVRAIALSEGAITQNPGW